MCFFEGVEFADGRTMSVNGPAQAGRTTAILPPRKDIFGSWLLTPTQNRSPSSARPMLQLLTPAGQRAIDAYDPFRDDPTFRCDPVAIRRVWAAPGTPLEIARDGRNMVVEIDEVDPEFFTEPLSTLRYEYIPSELKVERFNCSREGLTGTLRK